MSVEESCNCVLTKSDKVKECYQMRKGDETRHHVTFVDGFDVAHNDLLTEWQNAGFEVFSFGQNRSDVDNCTAVFTGPV